MLFVFNKVFRLIIVVSFVLSLFFNTNNLRIFFKLIIFLDCYLPNWTLKRFFLKRMHAISTQTDKLDSFLYNVIRALNWSRMKIENVSSCKVICKLSLKVCGKLLTLTWLDWSSVHYKVHMEDTKLLFKKINIITMISLTQPHNRLVVSRMVIDPLEIVKVGHTVLNFKMKKYSCNIYEFKL